MMSLPVTGDAADGEQAIPRCSAGLAAVPVGYRAELRKGTSTLSISKITTSPVVFLT